MVTMTGAQLPGPAVGSRTRMSGRILRRIRMSGVRPRHVVSGRGRDPYANRDHGQAATAWCALAVVCAAPSMHRHLCPLWHAVVGKRRRQRKTSRDVSPGFACRDQGGRGTCQGALIQRELDTEGIGPRWCPCRRSSSDSAGHPRDQVFPCTFGRVRRSFVTRDECVAT